MYNIPWGFCQPSFSCSSLSRRPSRHSLLLPHREGSWPFLGERSSFGSLLCHSHNSWSGGSHRARHRGLASWRRRWARDRRGLDRRGSLRRRGGHSHWSKVLGGGGWGVPAAAAATWGGSAGARARSFRSFRTWSWGNATSPAIHCSLASKVFGLRVFSSRGSVMWGKNGVVWALVIYGDRSS